MTHEQRYLEVVTENGARRVLTLQPGRDTGVWCLAGDGTLRPDGPQIDGAKVFLRFDGARLFVGTWDELQPPRQVTTGGVRIAYRVGIPPRERADVEVVDDDEEKTQIRARMVSVAPAPRPASSVPPSPPPPPLPKKADAPFFPRPVVAAKQAFSDDETRVGPPPDVLKKATMPVLPPPARGARPDARLEDTAPSRPKPKRGTRGLTPIRAAILAMLVVAVAVVAVGSSQGQIATAARRALGRTMATQTRPTAAVAPSAAHDPMSPISSSSTSALRPSASVAAFTSSTSAATPLLMGVVNERAAVLAVESGATERAARLYEGLASSHADRPAYREAVRILRAKNVTP